MVGIVICSWIAGPILARLLHDNHQDYGGVLASYIALPVVGFSLLFTILYVSIAESPNTYTVSKIVPLTTIPGQPGKYAASDYQKGIRHVSAIEVRGQYVRFVSFKDPKIHETSGAAYLSLIHQSCDYPWLLPFVADASANFPDYYNVHIPHGSMIEGYMAQEVQK
jgi:hypothetical protein